MLKGRVFCRHLLVPGRKYYVVTKTGEGDRATPFEVIHEPYAVGSSWCVAGMFGGIGMSLSLRDYGLQPQADGTWAFRDYIAFPSEGAPAPCAGCNLPFDVT